MANSQFAMRSKRKRAAVSYAEIEDDDFGDVPEGDLSTDTAQVEPDFDAHGADIAFGSRKVPKIKQPVAKKQPRIAKAKPSKSKTFRFLDLPPELRDQIYDLVFTQPGGLSVVSTTKHYRRTVARGQVYNTSSLTYRRYQGVQAQKTDVVNAASQRRQLVPNLLAVSKQLQAEGVGYLYKQPIVLEDTMALHNFLATIGQLNKLALTELIVKEWGHGNGINKAMNYTALTALSACNNLRKLYLDCAIDGYQQSPQKLAKRIYMDGHHFFDKYGAANGARDAAVDVLELGETNFGPQGWNRYCEDTSKETQVQQFKEELRRLLRR